MFHAALGLTVDDAEWLRERVHDAARDSEAVNGPPSPFGEKYVLDFKLEHAGRKAIIRTTWIIEYGTDFPRLTSCYVL